MVLTQALSGFVLGYVVGIFFKTATKILLFIIGSFLAFLIFLQTIGIATIHWTNIQSLALSIIYKIVGLASGSTLSLLTIPIFGVSFLLGFFASHFYFPKNINQKEIKYFTRKQ